MSNKLLKKALTEESNVNKMLEMVTCIQFLNNICQQNQITKEEFANGKNFLMHYNGEESVSDIQNNYLDAIIILHDALAKRVISNEEYHWAVVNSIKLRRNKELARLLRSRIINFDDYRNPDHSQMVKSLHKWDACLFGYTPPITIILMFTEEYSFQLTSTSMGLFSNEYIFTKGPKRFTVKYKYKLIWFLLLIVGAEKAVIITDESGIKYNKKELTQKLTELYGRL